MTAAPHRIVSLFAAVAAASVLSACGGGGGGGGSVAPGTDAQAPSPSPAPAPSPAPTATGTASDCFNAALFNAGTTYQLDYDVSGPVTGTSSTAGSVGAATTFNGFGGITPINQTVTTDFGAGASTVTSVSYQALESRDILSYGVTVTMTPPGGGGAVNTVTTYDPAARDKTFTLGVGATTTTVYNETSTATPPGTTSTLNYSTESKYIGQESVTVPAGTYNACKFEYTTAGATTTAWVSVGTGATVKSMTPDGSGGQITMQMKASSRLNGAPI